MRSLKGTRRGQSRIVESVLAALVIFVVFSVAIYLVASSKTGEVYERGDLDRAGYNLLHTLAESRAIEETLEDPAVNQTSPLYMVVQRFLPPMSYFRLTIYKVVLDPINNVTMLIVPVNVKDSATISNAGSEESFERSVEVSSTSFIYTSRNGNIYLIVLKLARGGEGA